MGANCERPWKGLRTLKQARPASYISGLSYSPNVQWPLRTSCRMLAKCWQSVPHVFRLVGERKVEQRDVNIEALNVALSEE